MTGSSLFQEKVGVESMSKAFKMVTMALILIVILTLSLVGAAFADNSSDPVGPAPNSGDGIPDGPGFDDGIIPNGPSGDYRSQQGL